MSITKPTEKMPYKPWFTKSRYYNPRLQSPLLLHRLQDAIEFKHDDQQATTRNISILHIPSSSSTSPSSRVVESSTFPTSLSTTHREHIQQIIKNAPVTAIFIHHKMENDQRVLKGKTPRWLAPDMEEGFRATVGLDKGGFEWLMEEGGVHPCILEAVRSHTGYMASFVTRAVTGHTGGGSEEHEVETEDVEQHMIIKLPPTNILSSMVYIRYNQTTNRLFVLVGNNQSGHDMRDYDVVFSYLSALTTTATLDSRRRRHSSCSDYEYADPFELLLHLLNRYAYILTNWKILLQRDILRKSGEIERKIDQAFGLLRTDHTRAPSYNNNAFHNTEAGGGSGGGGGLEEDEGMDTDWFDIRGFQYRGFQASHLLAAVEYQVKLSTYIQSLHSPSPTGGNAQQSTVSEYLTAHSANLSLLHSSTTSLQSRISRQLTALNTLLTQHDAALSLRSTTLSTAIAKDSTSIAADSRRLAVDARRDSTSMKTIAGLTMVYLPSTFAATVFSTQFFFFGDGDGRVKVRGDVWKFVVVAVVLSAITVVVWVWLNKTGIPRGLGWARQRREEEEGDGEKGMI